MNKWVKRKWVRALRSGDYKQGIGYLVTKDDWGGGFEHCCLGVLACEMAPEFVRKINDYEIGIDDAYTILPDDFAIMFGVDMNTQDTLSEKNDDGVPFPVIADWLEENL